MQFKKIYHNNAGERVQYASTTRITGYLGGTDQSDMPFVYHHLKRGCILTLNSITGANNNHLMFSVNYGAYRLGVLSSTLSKRVQQLQTTGKMYRITIAEVVKEKYLPPTAILVELESENNFLPDVA